MSEKRMSELGESGGSQIAQEDWIEWCRNATQANAGRNLSLRFEDQAIGAVSVADGVRFVAIEHDELGGIVALTVRYGAGVVPIEYAIAAPRTVSEVVDEAAEILHVTIVDSTGRRTLVRLG